MLKNNQRNFLIFLKKEINNKKTINKSIIQNKHISLKYRTYSNIFFKIKHNNHVSQLTGTSKQTKKNSKLSRWDLYHLYTLNELGAFKKIIK